MAKKVLTHLLTEPLDGTITAKVDIHTGTGNLAIDALGGEQVLASGTLEYMEGQDPPTPSVSTSNGRATFTLKAEGGRQPSFRMPWSTCNAATNWQIHLNPGVCSEISAHSGGGNVTLDLSGMAVTHVSADAGGGNMHVVLPEHAANLTATAKSGGGNVTVEIGNGTKGSNTLNAGSGAGNVVVRVPGGLAALIQATTGMGKVTVDPRFNKIDSRIYKSPDYDAAIDKVEITVSSGAGNVSVSQK